MPSDITAYRVFIASPGGLEAERALFRRTLDEYNDSRALREGALFIPAGWEDLLSATGRPQALINEELRRCDYFLLLLWNRWGSPPGEGAYESGTEEEYEVAMRCLEDPAAPLEEVSVLFKALSLQSLGQVDAQLLKVRAFHERLERERGLLFQTFETEEQLELTLRRYLDQWVNLHKNPARRRKRIDRSAIPDSPLRRAEAAAHEGRASEAEPLYQQAAHEARRASDWRAEAAAWAGLANLALSAGKPKTAESRFVNALAAIETASEGAALTEIFSGIAEARRQRRYRHRAEFMYGIALKTAESARGKGHPSLAPVLDGYAAVMRDLEADHRRKAEEQRARNRNERAQEYDSEAAEYGKEAAKLEVRARAILAASNG